MTTRQLSSKRSIYTYKKENRKIIIRNYGAPFIDILTITGIFSSLPAFEEDLYNNIMNYAKEIPSDIEFEMFCVTFITSIVLYLKNKDFARLPYTFLTKKVLPEMWRSRKEIELKRQYKLESLANLLDNDGRYQEAHVIRIIVKPHLERMNRKWTNMTALEKFKSLFS